MSYGVGLRCALDGSRIAGAAVKAGSYSSDLTPSLGTSICYRCVPKKTKEKKKEFFDDR